MRCPLRAKGLPSTIEQGYCNGNRAMGIAGRQRVAGQRLGSMLVLSLLLGGCASSFEQMWAGMAECRFDGLYLDPISGQPGNPALARYHPWKVEEGLAWYRTKETFHQIPISGFVVPAAGFDVHLLFIALPLDEARQAFLRHVGSEFSDVRAYRDGHTPLLTRNRLDLATSVLDCTLVEPDEELTHVD